MSLLARLRAAIDAYFVRDQERWDKLHSCEHRDSGACADCDDQVRSERW